MFSLYVHKEKLVEDLSFHIQEVRGAVEQEASEQGAEHVAKSVTKKVGDGISRELGDMDNIQHDVNIALENPIHVEGNPIAKTETLHDFAE